MIRRFVIAILTVSLLNIYIRGGHCIEVYTSEPGPLYAQRTPRVCCQSYGKGKVAMAVCRKAAVVSKSPAKARDPLMQGRRTVCPRTETYVQSLHVQETP
jgi:hypothetical protein